MLSRLRITSNSRRGLTSGFRLLAIRSYNKTSDITLFGSAVDTADDRGETRGYWPYLGPQATSYTSYYTCYFVGRTHYSAGGCMLSYSSVSLYRAIFKPASEDCAPPPPPTVDSRSLWPTAQWPPALHQDIFNIRPTSRKAPVTSCG